MNNGNELTVALLKEIIEQCDDHVSDIHLQSGQYVYVRKHNLEKTNYRYMADGEVESLLSEALYTKFSSWKLNRRSEAFVEGDYPLVLFGRRFRTNIYKTQGNYGIALRHIPNIVPTVEDLMLPEEVVQLAELEQGLVLITGPTGSGKSTTQAALVDYINRNAAKHIVTLENPIEFVHQSNQSLITHREIGSDVKNFNEGLKDALREDPDVILIGEMRDLETIRLALSAAETGHLVIATLHANSAIKAIDRMLDVFTGEEKQFIGTLLSAVFEASVTQRLEFDGEKRTARFEVLRGTTAIKNLIKENKTSQMQSYLDTGRSFGMLSFGRNN